MNEVLAASAPELSESVKASHAWGMLFGAELQPEGGVRFRLWAPQARSAELLLWQGGKPQPHATEKHDKGWYEAIVRQAGAGTRYQWRIDGETDVPDPASRFNPEGPHQPSMVVDPGSFAWDTGWRGRAWAEAVIYEMHIGTFTPEGTYAAAEARLQALADTGITAIELMPLSDFPGRFGWGYDGVLPYAPHAAYGSPDELKHFIQAAHRLGLMVFLDVVYNHFGPDGNYLGLYAPQFFSQVHTNPWGNSLNFDREGSETVRAFFVQNALYWLQEYRFDGLRLDAIHAIVDDSALDVIDELALQVHKAITDRHVHLVLENENNGWQRLPEGGRYDAQWNDDFHHVMYVALTGDKAGYYHDFGEKPVALLARSLTHGFLWQGSKRSAEGARLDLKEAPAQPLGAMVNFLNNHDQSGNRAFGERFDALVPAAAIPLATAMTLLSPAIPMLFAGEEYGAETPFLYFADWEGELRQAVVEGRLRDFGHFAQRADGSTGEPPPPCDASTFEAARLDWEHAFSERGGVRRGFVRQALAARRQYFVPRLDRLILGAHVAHMVDERSFVLRWRYQDAQTIELQARLADTPMAAPAADALPWKPLVDTRTVFQVGEIGDDAWQPWSGRWTFGRETG
ncbi:malto-oligosyltrehalose trehalohydrolase [Xylophilus rhododendri]|uniref:Malto-oligosyltrehalose trehalohydrolase n=1 Tax=Xylophilus rhododendri TaxID=2697032 RepID=A0A857J1A7_9BURK|nr:malto-oligosyltrehalose trehalohydrolase [Xylophilus rhododendri]QHI97357.1 malto-oligosyltrehalose trehalohydrolase [Xylophilus rhododendri]